MSWKQFDSDYKLSIELGKFFAMREREGRPLPTERSLPEEKSEPKPHKKRARKVKTIRERNEALLRRCELYRERKERKP